MYLQNKFFRFLFGVSGTRAAVPDDADPSGYVSYEEGFPSDYELPKSNPSRKPVPRDKTNQIYYDLTSTLKQYQQYGIPEWVAAADNDGVALSYSKGIRVYYSADAGATWNIYKSLQDSNTATPGTDATKWALESLYNQVPSCTSAGTGDAITATFTPTFTSYADVIMVAVRATAANTLTNPTINIDGIGVKTIVKGANSALAAGDIPGAGFWMLLTYDVTLGVMVLNNPYGGQSQVIHVQDQKASGTDGGALTSGAYYTRDLNTVLTNTITGASLATNKITLPPGSYEIYAGAEGLDVGNHKIKLYNTTAAADVLIGFSENNTQGSADPVSTLATVNGFFTIASTSDFEIRHRCSNTQGSNGRGSACAFGDVEVYAEVIIKKL